MIKPYVSKCLPVMAVRFSKVFSPEMFQDFAKMASDSGSSVQMNIEGNLFNVVVDGIEMNKGDWLCRTLDSGLFVIPSEIFSEYFQDSNLTTVLRKSEEPVKDNAEAPKTVVEEAKANDEEDEEDEEAGEDAEDTPEAPKTVEELYAIFSNIAEEYDDVVADTDDGELYIGNANGEVLEALTQEAKKYEDAFEISIESEDDNEDGDESLLTITITAGKK